MPWCSLHRLGSSPTLLCLNVPYWLRLQCLQVLDSNFVVSPLGLIYQPLSLHHARAFCGERALFPSLIMSELASNIIFCTSVLKTVVVLNVGSEVQLASFYFLLSLSLGPFDTGQAQVGWGAQKDCRAG